MAASVASAALTSAATSGGIALALLKLMAMTKLKITLGTVIVAGIGTTLVLEQQTLVKLRAQNRALVQQGEQLSRQAETLPRQSALAAPANDTVSVGQKQFQELNRLRGAIGALRPPTNELAKLRAAIPPDQR